MLTERRLKYTLGLFLVGAHFLMIAYVLVLFFMGGFNMDELTTLLAVLSPVWAGFSTSILSFFIREAKVLTDTTAQVNLTYAALSFALPSALLLANVIAIQVQAMNLVFSDFEEFKRFLILSEGAFAGYAGMFVYSLFQKAETPQAS